MCGLSSSLSTPFSWVSPSYSEQLHRIISRVFFSSLFEDRTISEIELPRLIQNPTQGLTHSWSISSLVSMVMIIHFVRCFLLLPIIFQLQVSDKRELRGLLNVTTLSQKVFLLELVALPYTATSWETVVSTFLLKITYNMTQICVTTT